MSTLRLETIRAIMAEHPAEPTSVKRDRSLMVLTGGDVIAIFAVLALVLVVCGYLLIGALLAPVEGVLSDLLTFQILIFSSLCGTAIYHGRKLYKAGINREYGFIESGWPIARISTLAFYALRLPASGAIAVVVYALWRLSFSLASGSEIGGTDASKYLFLVMGFFSGFAAGRFIEYFEREGFSLARTTASADRSPDRKTDTGT